MVFIALFNIDIMATHIAGVSNEAADMLSRNHTERFLTAHPHASQFSTTLSIPLINLITPQQLDWTFSSFLHHFQEAVSNIQMS